MRTCILANGPTPKKKTQKIGRKHRTPSEKEKNRNAKSVPMCIRFSPTRSKKSQPKRVMMCLINMVGKTLAETD